MCCRGCTRQPSHDCPFWPTRATPVLALGFAYPYAARLGITNSTTRLEDGTTTSTVVEHLSSGASLFSRFVGALCAASVCVPSASETSPLQRSSLPSTRDATEKDSIWFAKSGLQPVPTPPPSATLTPEAAGPRGGTRQRRRRRPASTAPRRGPCRGDQGDGGRQMHRGSRTH